MEDKGSLERKGIRAAIVTLLVGLIVAWIVNRYKVGDSATFIALLFAPLLTYGIVSGKIQEFTAPGGWGAKFQQIAQSKIAPETQKIRPVETEIVAKGAVGALLSTAQRLPRNKPTALSLQLGRGGYYTVEATEQYIETLARLDSDLTVLILEAAGRFVAMAEADTVLRYLRDPPHGKQLIDAIGGGNVAYLQSLPGFLFESLSQQSTNSEALEKMRKLNVKTMVVVDETGKPCGIVKRQDIVTELLTSLAKPG